MATIRIVHLSDLHFRRHETKDFKVWEEVRDFINREVRPDTILITGDLTDRAKPDEFKYAQQCLSCLQVQDNALQTPYRVIPGNHDRFLYLGNSAKPISRIWGLRWLARSKRGNFSQAFQGAVHVTPDSPSDIDLGNWKIRVIGLDSSERDEWFARGTVSDTSIAAACRAAKAAKHSDLVIVLVHHHVLPIPEAEKKSAKRGLRAVANVTGLLNSGSLLTQLSKSHVNVVLHGHEHYRNQARFRAGENPSSEVVVLAAGSGTGEETRRGWALDRVHFNVIELHDDRNVWLREVKGMDDGLSYVPGQQPLLLFSAEEIRRSRFLRRDRKRRELDSAHIVRPLSYSQLKEGQLGLPYSQIKKVVEFTLQRDINITEVRTNWLVQDKWMQDTLNASGKVSKAEVMFEWAQGERDRFEGNFLQKDPGNPEEYKLGIPLGELGGHKALRVTTSWTWVGGAALTLRERDMLPPEAKGGYRAKDTEFVAIRAPIEAELQALTMTVRIPGWFAPDPRNVKVCKEKLSEPGKLYPAVDLEESLEFCGNSTIELRIPFPIPGDLYVVAWPVPNNSCVSDEAQKFAAAAAKHADKLLNATKSVLKNEAWLADASIALYTLEESSDFVLQRLAYLGPTMSPEWLRLKDARGLSRAAWWGDPIVVSREGAEDETDFLPNEKLLAMVPVRGREALGQEALGILRITLPSNPCSTILDQARLEAVVAEAAYSVLQNARYTYQGDLT